MHEVNDNPYQVSESLFVDAISEEVNQVNQVFVNIEIGNKKTPVSFKLDTGALSGECYSFAFVSPT